MRLNAPSGKTKARKIAYFVCREKKREIRRNITNIIKSLLIFLLYNGVTFVSISGNTFLKNTK